MLDLRLNSEQSLGVETPSGDVEVYVVEVRSEANEATIEVIVPDDWATDLAIPATTYHLHDEFVVNAPDGRIRLKLLRFRPSRGATGGTVALGIDAPREWPILR